MSPELEAFLENEWYGTDSVQYVSDYSGCTALHMVADEPVEMVYELMSMMGDLIHHRDYDGQTALHWVDDTVSCEVMALLTSHLDQRVRSVAGDTALHISCRNKYIGLPLLKWHEIPNNKGQTPIYWVEGSHIHTLAKLRRLFGTLPAAYIRLVHTYT